MEFYLYTKLSKLCPTARPSVKTQRQKPYRDMVFRVVFMQEQMQSEYLSVSFQRWLFILKWFPLEDTTPYRLRVSKNSLIYFECTATFSQLFKNAHSAHLNKCTSVHANWWSYGQVNVKLPHLFVVIFLTSPILTITTCFCTIYEWEVEHEI